MRCMTGASNASPYAVGTAFSCAPRVPVRSGWSIEPCHFHTPPRDGLATDTSVWGTGAQPNRLLTIGCLQPSNPNAPSTRNIVVTWRYVGVR